MSANITFGENNKRNSTENIPYIIYAINIDYYTFAIPKLVHILLVRKNWRGARVADRGSLLRSCAFTGTGGSNPFLSAK